MAKIVCTCEKCGCEVLLDESAKDGAESLAELSIVCQTCHALLGDAITLARRDESTGPQDDSTTQTLSANIPRVLLFGMLPASCTGRIAIFAVSLAVFLAQAVGAYLLFGRGEDPTPQTQNDVSSDQLQAVAEPPPAPLPEEEAPAATEPPAVEPDANERFRMRLAAEELASIRRFWTERPNEREEACYRIWKLMERYEGTPAANEARQWWNSPDVPGDLRAQAGWNQDWTASGELPRVQFHDEWDHRHFVYETHPPSTQEPLRLSRMLHVPEDRPFLECPVRGHDQGDCEVWLEVGGRTFPHHTVASAWQRMAADLSAFKGRDVEVTLVHQATGWSNEYAFWQMPRFVKQAPAGSATPSLLTADLTQNTPTVRVQEDEEPESEELEIRWKKALNLLATVRSADDTVSGTWSMEHGELRCGRTSPARLVFPYKPPDEYAMRIVFTVEEHAEAVGLLLSKGAKNFCCVMGGWDNTVCGFALVNGSNASGNPTTVRRDGVLKVGQRHTMVVHVRRTGLKAFLDDQVVCQFKTDYLNVSADPGWNPDPGRMLWLGLGAWDTRVVFHSAEVVELSGKGRFQRLASGILTSALPNTERGVMARWLGELGDLMRCERFAEARQRVRELASGTSSSAIKSALDRDVELLAVSERLLKRFMEGFTGLTDHRPFELWLADGTRLLLGEKQGNRIFSVREGQIELEMEAGGGKVVLRVGLDHFSPRSQVDAALLVMPQDDSTLQERALGAVLRFRAGADLPPVAEIRKRLDALAKAPFGAPLVVRLRSWLEQAERERKAQYDFACLKAASTAQTPHAFERAAKAFENAHRETAAYEELLPELRKLKDDFGRRPGRKQLLTPR